MPYSGKVVFVVFLVIASAWLLLLSGPRSQRSTEMVCFDGGGDIVFYESGYPPGNPRMLSLTKNVYKDLKTGKKLIADCQSHWGVNYPRGLEYWETKGLYVEEAHGG